MVGLVPLQAMLDAADYYIEKEGLFVLHEDQKVHLAINRLGLATLSPFNPKFDVMLSVVRTAVLTIFTFQREDYRVLHTVGPRATRLALCQGLCTECWRS